MSLTFSEQPAILFTSPTNRSLQMTYENAVLVFTVNFIFILAFTLCVELWEQRMDRLKGRKKKTDKKCP